MARPSKKAVELALTEWFALNVKATRITAKRDAEIQPLKDSYEKKCAPILEEAKQKLSPLQERMKFLEKEITKTLESGIDKETETVALSQVVVSSETSPLIAIAEVLVDEGDRSIDPQEFFKTTAPAKRDAKFWGCVKVLVQKAEKFLGEKINEIAKRPKVFKVKVSVKEPE